MGDASTPVIVNNIYTTDDYWDITLQIDGQYYNLDCFGERVRICKGKRGYHQDSFTVHHEGITISFQEQHYQDIEDSSFDDYTTIIEDPSAWIMTTVL